MDTVIEVLGQIGIKIAAGMTVDQRIAALAAIQHGVVARRQLLALGIGSDVIQDRRENGRLHTVHRGVYAVGHTVLSQRGRWMAAVLAAGPGAVLSHRSAAELHRMLDQRGGPVHVTIGRARSQRRGIRLHGDQLRRDEVMRVDGIPVTTPARTLLDLAATARPQSVERAFHEAEYLELTSPVPLPDLVSRYAGRAGIPLLRQLLARGGRHRTRTEMEADFLAFCDERGLPRPDDTNVCRQIHGRWIAADAVYYGARLIIELDGGSHRTGRRFDDDRARDRANLVDGWRTVRVTSRHLDHERDELDRDLRRLLACTMRF
jgi:very-short-patch-repair endonuclease